MEVVMPLSGKVEEDEPPKRCIIEQMRVTPVLRAAFDSIFSNLSIRELCGAQAVCKWVGEEKAHVLLAGSVPVPTQEAQMKEYKHAMQQAHIELQAAVEESNVSEVDRLCTKWYGNKRVLDHYGYRTPVFLAYKTQAAASTRDVMLSILFEAKAADRKKPYMGFLLADRENSTKLPNADLSLILLGLGVLGEILDAAVRFMPSSASMQTYVQNMSIEMGLMGSHEEQQVFSDEQRCAITFHQLFRRITRKEVEALLADEESAIAVAIMSVSSKTELIDIVRRHLSLESFESLLERFPYTPAFANTELVPGPYPDEDDEDQKFFSQPIVKKYPFMFSYFSKFMQHLKWLKAHLVELEVSTYGKIKAALRQPVCCKGEISDEFLLYMRSSSEYGHLAHPLNDEQLKIVARYQLLLSPTPSEEYLACLDPYLQDDAYEAGSKGNICEYVSRLADESNDWDRGQRLQEAILQTRAAGTVVDYYNMAILPEHDVSRGIHRIEGRDLNVSIYEVHKVACPNIDISKEAMRILVIFATDLRERLSLEASRLSRYSRSNNLSHNEIQTSVRLMVPAETSRRVLSAAAEVLDKFQSCASEEDQAASPSFVAGLEFSVSKMHKYLQKSKFAKSVLIDAPVFLAAILENIMTVVLKLAGDAAREGEKTRIIPRHLQLAVRGNSDLDRLFGGVTIRKVGTTAPPGINAILVPKGWVEGDP